MIATTRDRIISATNELFRRTGYNATSLSQISKASGVTIGSIYHFFPGGKDALTVEVIRSTGLAYRDLFTLVMDQAPDIASGFAAFFDGAADVLVESDYLDPCPIGTVARETASTNDAIRAAAAEAFDTWIEAATVWLQAAGLAAADADDLAQVFVAAVEGGFVLSRTKRTPEPMRAAGRQFAPLIGRTLRGQHREAPL